MSMKIDKSIIDSLLEPLKLSIEKSNRNNIDPVDYIHIKYKEYDDTVYWNNKDNSFSYSCHTFDHLLKMILNDIVSFECYSYQHYYCSIRNPYFGCSSLEEAMIKKDIEFADHHPNIFETE